MTEKCTKIVKPKIVYILTGRLPSAMNGWQQASRPQHTFSSNKFFPHCRDVVDETSFPIQLASNRNADDTFFNNLFIISKNNFVWVNWSKSKITNYLIKHFSLEGKKLFLLAGFDRGIAIRNCDWFVIASETRFLKSL